MKISVMFWPDWNALDSVRLWHTVFEVAGIALLVLLLGAEILAFRFGQRKDLLLAKVERAQAAIDQKHDDNVERRHAEEVRSLKEALAETTKKAAAFDRLRLGRHLSAPQKQAITTFLVAQPKARFTIQASVNAPDARAFADDIASAFRAAGWTVSVEDAILMESDSSGVWLAARGSIGMPAPAIAQAIYGALKSADIPVKGGALRENNLPSGEDAMLKIGQVAN